MVPDLSVVVLSWNVAGLLGACLRSLPEAAGVWWPRTEVIVVDNASTDDSVEMVRRDFPGVHVIALSENRGFAGGNNAGILASRGRYVFLLNPDTVAHPGSIAALADYMEAHPDAGIAGPRLLNPDGTLQSSRRRFPSLATAPVESTPLQRVFPDLRLLRDFYMLDRPDGETQRVGWLSGAALMCRREALWQAGLFDPGYFMFSEEVDLCRRVSDAGWEIVYLPHAEVTHYGGQSTGQDVPARHINFNTSKVRYFRLHEGRTAAEFVRFFLLATYGVQTLSEAAKWLLGHKRPLRAERVRLYARVLKSGLREPRRQARCATQVLLITGEYPPARGGVGDYTCRLGMALSERGVGVEVLARAQEQGLGVGGWGLGTRSDPQPLTPNSQPPLTVRRITLRSTLRALRGSGSRIAHIQYQTGAYEMRPTVNMLPLLLKRRWRGATVVTFHDLLVPYLFPKAGRVREWANRLLARTADAAVATNPADAERLRSWGVRRVRLIPIGSNIPADPPAGYSRERWRSERGIIEGTTLLAYFGFLNSTKGLDDLLRALAELKGMSDFRLVMVGGGLGSSDPTNRATAGRLDALARDLGVHGDLIWTGYLSPREVSAALLSCDAAVLPYADGASFRRGSLLAVLEHGLPVITTTPAKTGLSEPGLRTEWDQDTQSSHSLRGYPSPQSPRLVDGENALLVQPGDPAALVRAVLRLASEADLRARLARGASELASWFSWDRIARMHDDLYRELLGR